MLISGVALGVTFKKSIKLPGDRKEYDHLHLEDVLKYLSEENLRVLRELMPPGWKDFFEGGKIAK